jgi:hypothetical protein
MSNTHKIQKAWEHHHIDGPSPDPSNAGGSNAALRHGNNRKMYSKLKVTERRIDRARDRVEARQAIRSDE